MPKQLTIFDVEPKIIGFDARRAHWKQLSNTETYYTDVVVKVPRRAKLPTEGPLTTAYDRRYELFEQYCHGIWVYRRGNNSRFSWEAAMKLFQKVRDCGEDVAIRLYRDDHGISFQPEHVVQYLK